MSPKQENFKLECRNYILIKKYSYYYYNEVSNKCGKSCQEQFVTFALNDYSFRY